MTTQYQDQENDEVELELLGQVVVDSGMLLICDPCNGGEVETDVFALVDERESVPAQLVNDYKVNFAAIAHVGHDGFYEVYLEKVDGEVTGIYIPMKRIV